VLLWKTQNVVVVVVVVVARTAVDDGAVLHSSRIFGVYWIKHQWVSRWPVSRVDTYKQAQRQTDRLTNSLLQYSQNRASDSRPFRHVSDSHYQFCLSWTEVVFFI